MPTARTLLALTQDILTSLDGDEIASIADTTESASVASIIRQNFYEIVALHQVPDQSTVTQLTATSAATPVLMTLPAGVIEFSALQYDMRDSIDTNTDYVDLKVLSNKDFLSMTDGFDTDANYVDTFLISPTGIGPATIPVKYRTDKFPEYYTILNDTRFLFDSFSSADESYLTSARSLLYCVLDTAWSHTDSFVPFTKLDLENMLFQQSKVQAFYELKQSENQLANMKHKRAWRNVIKRDYADNGTNSYYNSKQLPNYGRK
jgi:hypothetical protein